MKHSLEHFRMKHVAEMEEGKHKKENSSNTHCYCAKGKSKVEESKRWLLLLLER